MTQKIEFQQLDLSNAFLFAAAMEDPETCRLVLEMILGFSIPPVQVHAEHTILYSSDFRSVRLDIYASDETYVDYNVEMQNENNDKDKSNLPKRSRYHQAEMDVSSLKPGQDFRDLKPSYVIFICTFDPFGQGLYRYTYRNICDETKEVLGDETVKIFLNTKGIHQEDVPESLVHFLHYVVDSTQECVEQEQDCQVEKLHEKIQRLKASRRWENRYMTIGEWGKQMAEEATSAAQNRMLSLVNAMIADGCVEDIARLGKDSDFLQEMLDKYHIEETNL